MQQEVTCPLLSFLVSDFSASTVIAIKTLFWPLEVKEMTMTFLFPRPCPSSSLQSSWSVLITSVIPVTSHAAQGVPNPAAPSRDRPQLLSEYFHSSQLGKISSYAADRRTWVFPRKNQLLRLPVSFGFFCSEGML